MAFRSLTTSRCGRTAAGRCSYWTKSMPLSVGWARMSSRRRTSWQAARSTKPGLVLMGGVRAASQWPSGAEAIDPLDAVPARAVADGHLQARVRVLHPHALHDDH